MNAKALYVTFLISSGPKYTMRVTKKEPFSWNIRVKKG